MLLLCDLFRSHFNPITRYMSIEKYNKEQIRNRMLKYAATFWGIKKAENFDPVVKLLLEALANEMYMLGEDFTAIETRLLEKTARILTPGILTSPFPAHGIVHAFPIEPVYLITRESGMYYESDSLIRKLSTGSISFYPACDTLLHRADIRYMVCNSLLYRIDHTLEKTMIARTESKMTPRTVWLGLAVDESITNLRNFSFYLDFPNLTESYEYLFLLPCTEWSVKGEQVVMQRGIYEKDDIQDNPFRAFFQNYDAMFLIDKEIMEIYNKHFLSVRQSFPLDDSCKETLPEELHPCFKEAVREKMQDRLVWLKIQFPAHFTAEVMDELQAGINIVPVENKLLREQVSTLEDTFRVIPLRTENHESLLSVHSVKDSDGKSYHELLYPEGNSKAGYGTYSIRKGGCERFDSRSAKELLCYLLDLLDDETHAFGSVSSIKLQALATQMEQLVAQMKQTADNMNEFRETPYYLMIDQLTALFPEKRQTMVFSATIEGPLVPHIEKAIGARFSYFGESVKTASRVRHHFLDMRHVGKNEALRRFLELKRPYLCLVFASTKDGVRSCYEYLRANGVKCLLFSGELTDRERKRALKQLRTGEFPVIVCSDLLSRGIDLPDVTDVVSLDLPSDLSYYYHRAGRSGRFGKEGDSYVFYDKGDSARAEELFAKGLQADFLALRKDGIWEDPVGFAPKRKLSGAKKPLPDDERREILIAKAKTRPGKVKPGYKRKRKLAIEKVKGKYRRKAISKAISKSKKEKGK